MKQYIALFAFAFGIVAFAQHGPRPHQGPHHRHHVKKVHHHPRKPHHPPVVVVHEHARPMPPKVVRVHNRRSTNVAVQLPNNVGIQVDVH